MVNIYSDIELLIIYSIKKKFIEETDVYFEFFKDMSRVTEDLRNF